MYMDSLFFYSLLNVFHTYIYILLFHRGEALVMMSSQVMILILCQR